MTEEDKNESIRGLAGKRICRLQVFPNKDVSIGFGEKVYHGDARLRDDFYGEWEIGTWHKNWIVCARGMNLLNGRREEGHEILEVELASILNGRVITGIEGKSGPSVCVSFSGDLSLLVGKNEDREDEMFHIFGPDGKVIFFSETAGWEQEVGFG